MPSNQTDRNQTHSPYRNPSGGADPLPVDVLRAKQRFWNRMTWLSLVTFLVVPGGCALLTGGKKSAVDAAVENGAPVPREQLGELLLVTAASLLVILVSLGFILFSALRFRSYRKRLDKLTKGG